ncbi:MAG TPA: hypothetical protein VEV86_07040, partial [Vicinamibacterales bacterium]|nr:hypothetical protein [Vicinamibacterales bacterium]
HRCLGQDSKRVADVAREIHGALDDTCRAAVVTNAPPEAPSTDGNNGFYYQTIEQAITREGDLYKVFDVLAPLTSTPIAWACSSSAAAPRHAV